MLVEDLVLAAERFGGETGIVDDFGSVTFGELADRAAGIAKAVRGGGITSRERVGILLPAGAKYGVLMAGKTVVPINYLLGAKEIFHAVADAELDAVLTTPLMLERMAAALPGAEELVKGLMGSGKLKLVDVNGIEGSPVGELEIVKREGDETAVVMYTSATTGLPKGVVLTYDNLHSGVESCIEYARLEHRHRFLGLIPLFHSFGMAALMLAPIKLAAMTVYQAKFSAPGVLTAIREHGVSLMFGVPAMFGAVARLKEAKAEDFAGMYAMISGGEPLPAAVREAYSQRFGVKLFEGYGLTETAPVLAFNLPHCHRAGSVGRPLPGVSVRIAGEDGKEVALGAEGEVQVKGRMVFKGYLKNASATEAAFTADGYFRTGDLGKVDADGYLYITGRLKDLIISAGEKVHPREIEEVILRHPAIAEAAVVGKRDELRGEVPVAFVVLREGQSVDANGVRGFCREQKLAGWQVPKEVWVVEGLPRSPTGKVLKRELAKRAEG
jgi:long-chain acyl-CoA synthetase